jgi:hypothetical protein
MHKCIIVIFGKKKGNYSVLEFPSDLHYKSRIARFRFSNALNEAETPGAKTSKT